MPRAGPSHCMATRRRCRPSCRYRGTGFGNVPGGCSPSGSTAARCGGFGPRADQTVPAEAHCPGPTTRSGRRHRPVALRSVAVGPSHRQFDLEGGATADVRTPRRSGRRAPGRSSARPAGRGRCRACPSSRRRSGRGGAVPPPGCPRRCRSHRSAGEFVLGRPRRSKSTTRPPSGASSEASMALVTMFSTARWMPSGSICTSGMSAAGLPGQDDPQLLGPRLHQFDHVADRLVQVDRLQRRLAILGEGQHVHDQVVNLGLVLLDDRPTPTGDRLVLLLEPQVDQVASAAQALEDVLDVVREGGDGLADGRQPLGLELGLVEPGVLDRQARPGGRWRPSAGGGRW